MNNASTKSDAPATEEDLFELPRYQKSKPLGGKTLQMLRASWDTHSKPPIRFKTPFLCFVSDFYKTYSRYLHSIGPVAAKDTVVDYWKNLTKDEKARYVSWSKYSRWQYDNQLTAWKLQYAGGRIPRVRRRRKNQEEPKRTRNAYIFYKQENYKNVREQQPFMRHRDIVALIALNWRSLDKAQKQPYLLRCFEDKQRYKDEMKVFRANRKFVRSENAIMRKQRLLNILETRRMMEKLGFDPYDQEDAEFESSHSKSVRS